MDSKKILELLRKNEDKINSNCSIPDNKRIDAANAMMITYGLVRIAEAIEAKKN